MNKKDISEKLFNLYFVDNYPKQYMEISNKILKEVVKEESQKLKSRILISKKLINS